MSSFEFRSLQQTREDLIEGKYSAVDLCQHYLDRISNEDQYNAYLEVFTESSIALAQKVDESISKKVHGRLAGAIVAIKDNLCYQGHRVSAASKTLEGFESVYTATAVQRLIDEGAIIIGRLNCDEFAMGSSNENSAFGGVKNPIDLERVPGGSSGGSAAAVAADLCMVALGSDTGGSIRQPASFTGTVGLKPTYGRISRYGLIAFASSFDQIGPIAKSYQDAQEVYECMAGSDKMDLTCSSNPVTSGVSKKDKHSFVYLKEVVESPGLNPEIKAQFMDRINRLSDQGHSVSSVSFPYLDHMIPCYYVLTTAEASSNLGRYDGVHYGKRSEASEDVPSTYFNSRTEGFGKEVKRRIMLGTFVLSTGFYDAYYSKAQKVRRLIKTATEEMLNEADFVISPTTPHPAFKVGEKLDDNISLYLEDIFTVQANLAGNPAIAIPMGETSEGLPTSIQLMGKPFAEEALFQGAACL